MRPSVRPSKGNRRPRTEEPRPASVQETGRGLPVTAPETDAWLDAKRHQRRNYFLGVSNGAFFGFIDSVLSPYIVLSVFVNNLGGSNLLVGLLPAIYNGGWFLPQFLISPHLQRLKQKKAVYDAAALVRFVSWVLLVLSTFMLGTTHPELLLGLFFVLMTVYSFAGGFGGVAFMDIVAKAIPLERRGTFFGRRDLLGALTAILGGYIVNLLLSPGVPLAFPLNFGLLFAIAGVAIVGGLGSFSLVKEPLDKSPVQQVTMRDQVGAAQRVFRENHIYRRYLLTRIAVAAADIATPFYAIFATTILKVPLDTVGIYIALTTAASLLTNPLLSRLSDRRGHRIALVTAALGMLTMPFVAAIFRLLPPGPMLGIPFGLVFVVNGVTRSAGNISFPSYLLEIAPAPERPLYIGFTNSVLGIATFFPIVGGILLDLAGFDAVLALTLCVGALASWLAQGMVEPRRLGKIADR